jgi:glycosyltransferase involved in cell wall biosynthesis
VDRYVTNSHLTQARIRAYFGRDSRVVYPPVDTSRFSRGEVGSHYVVLSELMAHKRIDLAVQAFTRLGLPLIVAGDGPDARRLRSMAGPSVSFAGRVSDVEVAELLETCRALVVTAVEEFGIAAVEAQAAGRPVLSVGAGGALETVVDGVTGRLWRGGVDELSAAVREFDTGAVDPGECARSAARFDRSVFRQALPQEIERALARQAGEGAPHTQRPQTRPLRRPSLRERRPFV